MTTYVQSTTTITKSSIDDYLGRLQATLAETQQLIEHVEALRQRFPDLAMLVDRWDERRLISAQANAQVMQVDITHHCGCCADATLIARPYLVAEGMRVHSSPEHFAIGELDRGYDRAYAHWDVTLRAAHIAEPVIEQVRAHFAQMQAQRRAELAEELEELGDPPVELPEPLV